MTNLDLCFRPEPTRAASILAAKLVDQPPVAQRVASECAFRHPMSGDESLNVGEEIACHAGHYMRVATRPSSPHAGKSPIVRIFSRGPNYVPMGQSQKIDIAALKRAIIENTGPGKRFTRRGLSLLASGGKNPDLIRDLISRGQDKKLSFETVTGIASAMEMDVSLFFAGTIGEKPGETITVIGVVEAGVFRQHEQWNEEDRYPVNVFPPPIAGAERFGLEVAGFSMDKVFLPGTVLDCMGIPGTPGLVPQPGDIVIVRHSRGDLVETTCKRLELLEDGTFQLRAESNRPEFAEPIWLGKPDKSYFADDGIEIIGVVNTAITKVFRR